MFSKLLKNLRDALAYPATKDLALDDPELTALRKVILKKNTFLHRIYLDWYERICAGLHSVEGQVLEIGAGAGFLQEVIDGLITSDVFFVEGLSAVLQAEALPVKTNSLGALVSCNVLHHIPDVEKFFHEAARCVRKNGCLLMIEPWVTPWSKIVFQHLHHEAFEPQALDWRLPVGRPLSNANGALPWIIFTRDRARFEREHPEWKIRVIEPIMPILYLLSGGFSSRIRFPGWSYRPWKLLEHAISPWVGKSAMFAYIQLLRV